MKSIQYDENDPKQADIAAKLAAVISGHPIDIYFSPQPIERLKQHNVKYIRAKTIIEAIEKLPCNYYDNAYLINLPVELSPQDKIKLRKLLLHIKNKKRIHVCIDISMPFLEGLSVVSKSEGLKQLL